jgi:FMN-dependent NADH-azoreductase
VLGSIGLKTVQFFPVQATAFLDREQAALAREQALAAIDLTVMGESILRCETQRGRIALI